MITNHFKSKQILSQAPHSFRLHNNTLNYNQSISRQLIHISTTQKHTIQKHLQNIYTSIQSKLLYTLFPSSIPIPKADDKKRPHHKTSLLLASLKYIFGLKLPQILKQNMGGCQCNASKNISEEINNEIQVEPLETKTNFDQARTSQKQANEKRRGKHALLVNNQDNQNCDNVQFDQQGTISPTDYCEIQKALKKHFIFSQLSQGEVQCFIKQMKSCIAHRNTYIFKQGDKSGAYYIIMEGVCQVEINGEKKRTLAYGDSFGDLGIIYNAPRSASAFAVTDCDLAIIDRAMFKKVMDDINQIYEKENKKFLQVLSFFKDLTQEQKNAIASCCLTETYEEGQIIFNQGDDANSFYVIKQGGVKIKEKNQQLKAMDCFGQNSIFEGGVRAYTLVAKSRCKIISMSRQNIKTSLGDSLKNIILKNMVWRVLVEPKLTENLQVEKLKQAAQSIEFTSYKKGEVVIKKGTQYKNCILVVLNGEIKGATVSYAANSVVELGQITDHKKLIKIKEDLVAVQDGTIGKINYVLQTAPTPIALSMNQKRQQGVSLNRPEQSNLQKRMQISDFYVVRKLREGNFGKVYACWNTKTNKIYAVKVLDRLYVQKSQIIQYIMNEEQILRTVPRNQFIVSFYKLIKDSNFIYFIMDFIEGEDLFDVITKVVSFSPQNTRFLVSQILLMMEHMHNHRIIYRDLKPQNLMMGGDGYLTLVDMGTAKKLKIQRRFRTSTIIGTPHYIAPQIITGKGYSFPADLWSLGIIAYELLCGKLPFGQNSQDPFTIYEQVINESVKYPRNCPKSSKAFTQKMLNKSPQHRIGGGYEQLKKHIYFDGIDWKKLISKSIEPFYKPSEETKIKTAQIEKALNKQRNKAPGKFLADKSSK